MHGNSKSITDAHHEIYAFAHVETWIEDYARSNQLPAHELTERVADLLKLQTVRPILGMSDHLSNMRPGSAERTKGKRKTVALDDRPRRKTSLTGYKYPEGTHWTQKKENKARLRKIARNKFKKLKRKLSRKQLVAMRLNAKLARAARVEKLQAAA